MGAATVVERSVWRLVEPRVTSAQKVRRFLAEQLAFWGLADQGLTDDGRLVITELFSNALRHGQLFCRPVPVLLRWTPPVVRIEVHDFTTNAPRMVETTISHTGGRGLHLIAGRSSAWGSVTTQEGKYVYAELTSPSPTPS